MIPHESIRRKRPISTTRFVRGGRKEFPTRVQLTTDEGFEGGIVRVTHAGVGNRAASDGEAVLLLLRIQKPRPECQTRAGVITISSYPFY
jgi:hypothetical protein